MRWGEREDQCLRISPEVAVKLGVVDVPLQEVTVISDCLFMNAQVLRIMDSTSLKVSR